MRCYDTHCHPNFAAYRDDVTAVIDRSLAQGVGMIVVGTNYKTSQEAMALAQQYDGVYAAVGIHPIHTIGDITESDTIDGKDYTFTTKQEQFDAQRYEQLISSSDKIVAIGEVGLDYYRLEERDTDISQADADQRQTLEGFLQLARQHDLPVIFHCRGSKDDPYQAYDQLLDIIAQHQQQQAVRGVVHCFGGSFAQAQRAMAMGLYVGVTGIVTFKKAAELQRIATELPLEQLLIETDAPFLAPEPHRGKRNEPAYVLQVAERLAQLRGMDVAEVVAVTTANARKLFGVK